MLISETSETKQQATLWPAIKKALTEPNGREYFELNLRNAVVPGGAYGLELLRGSVVSSEPAANPVKLMVAMSGTATPEVMLLLKSPWNEPIPSGTEVEFSGVPVSFTNEPFLLTFNVGELALLPAQKLALEITDAGASSPLLLVLDGDGYLIRYGQSLAGLLMSNDGVARQPSALKLGYKLQQDTVTLAVSVSFRPFEGALGQTVLSRFPFEAVGTYSVHLNDLVLLSDLEKVNLRPLTVKIVIAADPSTPSHPMPISNVPSLQMEIASEDRAAYHLLLRNTSSQGVTAIVLDVSNGQGGLSSSVQDGDGSHVLIAPGATREVNFPRRAGDLAPLEIVLEAASFQDGTVEGNKNIAATLRGNRQK